MQVLHNARTIPEVLEWLRPLRDSIGRTYIIADITFIPCNPDKLWKPSFLDLSNHQQLQHSECRGPNPKVDNDGSDYALLGSHPHFHHPSSGEQSLQFSSADEEELLRLCISHRRFPPISSANENILEGACHTITHGTKLGRKPLTTTDKIKLLRALRGRINQYNLALTIARKLRWSKALESVGQPIGLQQRLSPMVALQIRSEQCGHFVRQLKVVNYDYEWSGAAGWLARIWAAVGEPIAQPGQWKRWTELGSLNLRCDGCEGTT